MWTKRSISPSPGFPQRIDLIRYLFEQLAQKRVHGSWIHLESTKGPGFLKNLFSRPFSFVEIGFGEDNFELNLGKQAHGHLEFPPYWEEIKKGLRKVPRSDSNALCNWIDSFFNKVCSSTPNKIVSGWVDGL